MSNIDVRDVIITVPVSAATVPAALLLAILKAGYRHGSCASGAGTS